MKSEKLQNRTKATGLSESHSMWDVSEEWEEMSCLRTVTGVCTYESGVVSSPACRCHYWIKLNQNCCLFFFSWSILPSQGVLVEFTCFVSNTGTCSLKNTVNTGSQCLKDSQVLQHSYPEDTLPPRAVIFTWNKDVSYSWLGIKMNNLVPNHS